MAIFVDPIGTYETKPGMRRQACNMACDGDLTELHTFAYEIGLDGDKYRENCQIPHYELNPRQRATAVKHGAKEISKVEMSEKWRARA
jgi:hypothetical protein